MRPIDREDEARLDQYLDALLAGAPPPEQLDSDLEWTLQRLVAAARSPQTTHAFVHRLDQQLMRVSICSPRVPTVIAWPGEA